MFSLQKNKTLFSMLRAKSCRSTASSVCVFVFACVHEKPGDTTLSLMEQTEVSYPNPPMLEAAVPSPKTLPADEGMLPLKEGLAPNAAAPPNAGGLPKEGGLPNTGPLPKPPVEKGSGGAFKKFGKERN